jgi:hypothetical protein
MARVEAAEALARCMVEPTVALAMVGSTRAKIRYLQQHLLAIHTAIDAQTRRILVFGMLSAKAPGINTPRRHFFA